MKVEMVRATAVKRKSDCLIVGVFEKKFRTDTLRLIDEQCNDGLTLAVREKTFGGHPSETLMLYAGRGIAPKRVLLVGLGPMRELDADRIRAAAGTAAATLKKAHIDRFTVDLDTMDSRLSLKETAQVLTEGVLLADYHFDQFLTQNRDKLPVPLAEMRLLTASAKSLVSAGEGMERAKKIYRGVAFARDLVNQPGNVKSPDYMAKEARQMAREVGMSCTILGKPELEKEGCGGILGVAQGSARDPRLILLEYKGGKKDQAPIALVGKGVVFDTGGISLKPAEKMDMMKMDMGGAAAVLGTLFSAALLELPINLVGIVPAVENMPSGTAYRPGDILTSLSGKTIEVLNTDAEGRLILADALTWAQRYQPELVIDLATLTGAVIIALGNQAAAVMGNDDRLAQQLIHAGSRSGERVWQLPLFDAYDEQIKSPVADVANIGGRAAGSITAAAFLKKFAPKAHWAHLDIAGMAWEEKGQAYQPKGGTGFGVRLLLDFLEHQKG